MFLNTLFSVSEAVMYAQLVDRLDQVRLRPPPPWEWNSPLGQVDCRHENERGVDGWCGQTHMMRQKHG